VHNRSLAPIGNSYARLGSYPAITR